MGAKASFLIIADGPVPSLLAKAETPDRGRSQTVLASLFPRRKWTSIEDGNLEEDCYVPDDKIYVGCYPGLDIVAYQDIEQVASQLTNPLRGLAEGRDVYAVLMHSVVDLFGIDVWRGGRQVRSFAMSADDGIIEDEGARFDHERPYWDGEHTLDEFDPEYPHPFHPLEFGEAMLEGLLGFGVEGSGGEWTCEPDEIALLGFEPKRPWYRRLLGRRE